MGRPRLDDVDALVARKLSRAASFQRAADAAMAKQREALERCKSLDAKNYGVSAAVSVDKSGQLEREAVALMQDYKRLSRERSQYFAFLIESVVRAVLPAPAARKLAGRLVADAMRAARDGEVRVSPRDAQAVEDELVAWCRPRLERVIAGELEARFRAELEQRVAARMWEAREDWERTRLQQLSPVSAHEGGRVVPGYLREKPEEGFSSSENGDGDGAPFVTGRRPIEERGPRREDYKTAYARMAFGTSNPSEFG